MTEEVKGLPVPHELAKRMSIGKVGKLEIRNTAILGVVYDGDIVDGLWYPVEPSAQAAGPNRKARRSKGAGRTQNAKYGIPNEPWVSSKLYHRALKENARMRSAFAQVIEDMKTVRDGLDEMKIEHVISYANVIATTAVDLELPGLPEA